MKTGRLVLILLALFTSGCAVQGRYDWNQYDQRLYDYYKNPATGEAFAEAMAAHVQALETAGKKPAPGLYAELGTFALSRGDSRQAVAYYSKERQAWPESRGLMSALIANIDKGKAEVSK